MTINELLAASGLTANDTIPLWDAEASGDTEPTQKITALNLAAALAVLGNYLTSSSLPLSIANGGSGLTASPSLLVNLASGAAADVMATSPRPGVTGALPVANGGTGANTASGAMEELSATARFYLDSTTYSDWPTVYAKITELQAYRVATVYTGPGAAKILLADNSIGAAFYGVIARIGEGSFSVFGASGTNLYLANISNATSSNRSTTKYTFTGTQS